MVSGICMRTMEQGSSIKERITTKSILLKQGA